MAVALLAVALAAAFLGLRSMREHAAMTNPDRARAAGQPLPVSTVRVETGPLDSWTGADCVARESRRMSLSNAVAARVQQVLVSVGDRVDAGQTLVELERGELEQVLDNVREGEVAAKVQIDDMEPYLSDLRALRNKAVVPVTDVIRAVKDLGQARLDLIRARNDVIQARHDLDRTRIATPLAGTVTEVNIAVGEMPRPYTDLLVVSGLDPLYLECAFPEDRPPEVQDALEIKVEFTAFPHRVVTAHFDRLLPVIEEAKGTFSVRLKVSNPDYDLLPGMHAVVRILKRLVGPRVPAITLIGPDGDEAQVFVVADDGKAYLRSVRTGGYAQGYIQVLEGLVADERVVAAGQMHLRDGDAVIEGKAGAAPESDVLLGPGE